MKVTLISSLRSKLILSLSIFVIGASVITSFIVYYYMFGTIKADRLHDLGQIAYNRHQLLKQQLYNGKRDTVNRLDQISKLCGVGLKPQIDEVCIYQRLEAVLKVEQAEGVILMDKKTDAYWQRGKINPSEAEQLEFTYGQLAVFSRPLQNEHHKISRSYYIRADDRHLNLTLIAKFPGEAIEKLFSSNQDIGKTGETFLADAQGYFITPPRYEHHGHGVQEGIAAMPMRTCLTEKQSGEVIDHDYRGAQIIHGFRYIPEIGGGCIMAHIAESEAFAFVHSLQRRAIATCSIFILISIILIVLFSYYIINPIKYLANVAEHISMGNYQLKSNIKRKDEIGVLSEAFNQMTSSLLQMENRFKLAVENIHDYAVTMLDTHGVVTNWNRGGEKIFGYSEAEVIGQHYRCFFSDEEVGEQIPERNLQSAIDKGGFAEEGERLRKNGERFTASVSVTPIFDEDHVHYGFIQIVRDITEKRRLEKSRFEAQRANFQKTTFLACMSHEIRTPLNSILGVTELLLDKKLTLEDKNLLEIAHAAGETLLTVINDTLDLSRIEAGEMQLEMVPFYLSEQMQLVLAMMEIRANEKKIQLKLNIEEELPDRYIGDPTRLRQIFINLLGNAIKFSEQGTVTLSVRRNLKSVNGSGFETLIFSVSDQGIGIPENQRELIFERFKQADETVTRRFGGTGLGLSISKKIVELMNGKIWVESVVGKGSTFYFTLHLKKQEEGVNVQSLAPKDSLIWEEKEMARLSRKVQILLADDSEDNRFIFQGFLKNFPCEITMAQDGKMALELYKSNYFDIVFMDVQMPVLDGYSATKEIRLWEKVTKRPRTPIIAFTANALDEDLRMSLAAGCNDHISKPLRKDRLMGIIRKFVSIDDLTLPAPTRTSELHS